MDPDSLIYFFTLQVIAYHYTTKKILMILINLSTSTSIISYGIISVFRIGLKL
jgi:hypothetical protein